MCYSQVDFLNVYKKINLCVGAVVLIAKRRSLGFRVILNDYISDVQESSLV